MAISLSCPHCQRPVQAPDELRGREVACPLCQKHFVIEAAAPPSLSPLPEDVSGGLPLLPRPEDAAVREAVAKVKLQLLGPAIGLSVASVLGIIADGIGLCLVSQWTPGQFEALFDGNQLDPQAFRLGQQVGLVFNILMIGLCLVIGAGAISLFRVRHYGLAVTGCVLGLVNLGNLCCCLCLPFSLWGLSVLFRAEVREVFRANRLSA